MFERQQSNRPEYRKGDRHRHSSETTLLGHPLSLEKGGQHVEFKISIRLCCSCCTSRRCNPSRGGEVGEVQPPVRHVLNVLGKPMKLWPPRALALIPPIRTPSDRMPIASAASKQALDPNVEQSIPPLRIMEGAARD